MNLQHQARAHGANTAALRANKLARTQSTTLSPSLTIATRSTAVEACGKPKKSRWLTFITTRSLKKDSLLSWGMDPHRVRIVNAKNRNDARWMAWEALSSGTSDAVVTDLGDLSHEEHMKLDIAGKYGDCELILLNSKNRCFH